METKFQTSFIPKKAAPGTGMPALGVTARTPQKKHGTSLLLAIGMVSLIISLAAAGGIYAWKRVLISSQDSYRAQLRTRETQFDLPLIEKLKITNSRIDLAKQLMYNHVAISNVFEVVARMTVESVQFTQMELSTDQSRQYRVSLRGHGANLSTVAFQSEVLRTLEQYGLRRVIKNPIISDPSQNENGTVSFNIGAALDPDTFSYEKQLTGQAQNE